MFVYSLFSFIVAILGVGILGLFFIIAICSIVYTFYSLIFNGRDKNNKDNMNNKSVQLKSLAYKNRLHNDSHLRREIALFKAGELIVRHKLGFDMAHCCNIEDLSFIDSSTDYDLSKFSSMKSATDMLVLLYSGLCGEYLGNDRKDSVSFISQNNLTGATNLVKNIIKHNYFADYDQVKFDTTLVDTDGSESHLIYGILEDSYNTAFDIVEKHKDALLRLAENLYNNGYVTKGDIKTAFLELKKAPIVESTTD